MPTQRTIATVPPGSTKTQIAQLIRVARNKAGLTQKQLAEALGTTQSTVARLEDSEYIGHSVSTLERVAKVLGARLDIRFVRT